MTWDPRRALIESDTPTWNAIKDAIESGYTFALHVEEGYTEPVLEIGDQVTVPFDHGTGPARIIGLYPEHGSVKIEYGPGGKYTTSVERSSVRTHKHRLHDATVTVIPDE